MAALGVGMKSVITLAINSALKRLMADLLLLDEPEVWPERRQDVNK
jgi:hypothetical protein